MLYTIDTSKPSQLNWESRGIERILQNVSNLINTIKYEVAYNRIMGIDPSIFDKPIEKQAPGYISQVYQIVSDYEPRATVKEVKFISIDEEGNADYKVVVEI